MGYYELNKDMHNSCVQTMKELVQYRLASQEDFEKVLRLQEQFEKESSLMCSQNKPTEEKIKEYLSYDPFYGEEADLTCRTLKIVKARKDHVCFSLDGKQDHNINKGDYYRYEKALVDGDFFGTYRLCLNCIDKFMKEEDEDES